MKKSIDFEYALNKLKEITQRLEQGEESLEKSIKLYEGILPEEIIIEGDLVETINHLYVFLQKCEIKFIFSVFDIYRN